MGFLPFFMPPRIYPLVAQTNPVIKGKGGAQTRDIFCKTEVPGVARGASHLCHYPAVALRTPSSPRSVSEVPGSVRRRQASGASQ
jgi:hypothetical protein